jgi:hypothetical protein
MEDVGGKAEMLQQQYGRMSSAYHSSMVYACSRVCDFNKGTYRVIRLPLGVQLALVNGKPA